jgi:hypothetical protein
VSVKLYALIPKRPDLSAGQFHAHWRNPHGELAKRITTLQRYVQSHRVPAPDPGLPEAPYDGIAEAWFADAATGLALGEDPNYTEHAQPDEANFMDVGGLAFLVTTEQVLAAGPVLGRDAPGVKLLQLVRRPPGADLAGWRAGFPTTGPGDLATALGARRHVVALSVPDSYTEDGPAFDAVRELSWPDAESFLAGRASAAWSTLSDPEHVDPNSSVAVLAAEHRVIWPGPDDDHHDIADSIERGEP